MKIAILACAVASGASLSFAATPDLSKLPPPSEKKDLTYARDIKPLLENTCFRCHGEQRQRGGLRLDNLEAALKGGEDGKVIVPGKSKESPLVIAVAQLDDETAMPPKRGPGGGGPGGGPGGGRGGFGPGMMLAPQMVSQADKDGDKKLTQAEFTGLADTWFDKMDPEKTGKLNQEQFTGKLAEVLPAPQGRGGPGGGPPNAQRPGGGPGGAGGGRGGFGPARFVGPGLFAAADTDKDGSVTRSEFKGTFSKWFTDWDKEKSGSLAEANIRDGLNTALPRPNFGGGGGGGAGGANGGPRGPGGFGGGGPGGGQSKPLTAEQVGLVRAWIDQGAK